MKNNVIIPNHLQRIFPTIWRCQVKWWSRWHSTSMGVKSLSFHVIRQTFWNRANMGGLGKLGPHHGIQDSKAFEDEHSVVDRRHVQIQIVYSVMKERPLTPCSLRGERMKSSVSCGRPKLPSSRVKLLKCGIYWMQDFGYCVPSRKSHVHTGPQKTFLKNHTITPSQAASHTLVEALRDERDWQKIDAVAVTLDELKGIEAIKEKLRKDDLGHSFEALAEFKKFCDKRDLFYVYRINDERQNNELSFAFKTSWFQASLGLLMDRDGTVLLHEKYCYIDAKHNRCSGFNTITLGLPPNAAASLCCNIFKSLLWTCRFFVP